MIADFGTNAAFQGQVEPLLAALEDLTRQTSELRAAAGFMPTSEARAMAEIAADAQYGGSWSSSPATDAHSYSWLYASVAENLVESLAAVLRDQTAHVFGPVVLARAALEAMGRSAWISDTTIDVRARIARSMSDRLYSISQEQRLAPARAHTAHYLERRRVIVEEAERQGFRKISRKNAPLSLEEARPGNTEIVRRLFGSGDLGPTIYGYWSALTHSTLYGLSSRLTPQEARDGSGPLVTAGLTASSEDARTIIRALLLAYVLMSRQHAELFGWTSAELERTVVNVGHLVRELSAQP